MCGIVGFSGDPDHSKLLKMTNAIYHRGPDDESFLETENFSIGFRRLSIIDLSKNIYPITNENENLFVFLNGEIYNYPELRDELTQRGHKFKTMSDTEVIVHGYEEWGENVMSRLMGMFVFVVYNKSSDSLFIARDRIGIKHLYYVDLGKRVIFSSEIKAIFAAFEEVNRSPNDQVIYRFLASRIHDTDRNTFFENIKRLPQGHYMTIDKYSNLRIEKYWNPKVNLNFSSAKPDFDYAQEFRSIFVAAVKRHLISDVPVGVTLSGGLDSTGIACVASKLHFASEKVEPFYSFSAIHPGQSINEEEYIDSVVNYASLMPIKVIPNVDTFWEDFETWLYFQEEPVISGAPYAYYVVMREAKKYVTVLLSGQGGDELLAGYIPYYLTYLQSALDTRQIGVFLREVFMSRDIFWQFIVDKLVRIITKNEIKPVEYLKNYSEDHKIVFKHKRNLNERLFEDVVSTTSPAFLRYEDKNSMANALESRVPFFDDQLVDYILKLPIDQKIKFGWTRYVYRNALKDLVPEKNRLRRSKIGFVNPEWEWIIAKKDKFLDIFSSESFKNRKYWDAEKVIFGFSQAVEGKLKGEVLFFWRIFIVEMWLRKYVDNFVPIDTKPIISALTNQK